MTAYAMERARDRIASLASDGLDLRSFWDAVREPLRRAVPHHLTPCWFTLDPASLLVTSHYDHGMVPDLPADWLVHEYTGEDVNHLAEFARSPTGLTTLDEATGGRPETSLRWREFVHPYGGQQELLLALRTRSQETWGVLALYRHAGQPDFAVGEQTLLREVAPLLAAGIRRALLVADASEPDGHERLGLLVLRDDWTVDSMTPGLEELLASLPGDMADPIGRLPPSVIAVAGRVLRAPEAIDTSGDVAIARVLSLNGQWMVLHGLSLGVGPTRRAAVIVERAHRSRIASLLMAANALTEREQEVTRLVLHGLSTLEIADALAISGHTVQEHMKHVFEKMGVRSRRELVGSIFFAHYEPRLRDNERRTIDGRPLRGGPMAPADRRVGMKERAQPG